jgi:hypothetical protein
MALRSKASTWSYCGSATGPPPLNTNGAMPCVAGGVSMTDVAERVGLAPEQVHAFSAGELETLQDFAGHFFAIAEGTAISSTGTSPFTERWESQGSASVTGLLIQVETTSRDSGELGLCMSQVDWAFRLAMAIASFADLSDTVMLLPRGTGPQVEDAGTGSVWVRLKQGWGFGEVESDDETGAKVLARMQERAAQYGLDAAQCRRFSNAPVSCGLLDPVRRSTSPARTSRR